jgi:pimeloyl-ACP methyl ester carboxylesterase
VDELPRALQPMARAIGLRSQAYDWLGGEGKAIAQSEAQVRAAGAFPPIPLVVLSAGGDWPQPNLRQAWLELQDELARLSPHGSHLIAEQSGHFIQLDQPELVVDAIRTVVERVRLERALGENEAH